MNPTSLGDFNLYAILQLDPSADSNAILTSYRRLARERHPDKNPNNPDATADFQRLQQAYSILGDPRERQIYDQKSSARNYRQNTNLNNYNRSQAEPRPGTAAQAAAATAAENARTPEERRSAANEAIARNAMRKPKGRFCQSFGGFRVPDTWNGFSNNEIPYWPYDQQTEAQIAREGQIKAFRKMIRRDQQEVFNLTALKQTLAKDIGNTWAGAHQLEAMLLQSNKEKTALFAQYAIVGADTTTSSLLDKSKEMAAYNRMPTVVRDRYKLICAQLQNQQVDLTQNHDWIINKMQESSAIVARIEKLISNIQANENTCSQLRKQQLQEAFHSDTGFDGWVAWDEDDTKNTPWPGESLHDEGSNEEHVDDLSATWKWEDDPRNATNNVNVFEKLQRDYAKANSSGDSMPTKLQSNAQASEWKRQQASVSQLSPREHDQKAESAPTCRNDVKQRCNAFDVDLLKVDSSKNNQLNLPQVPREFTELVIDYSTADGVARTTSTTAMATTATTASACSVTNTATNTPIVAKTSYVKAPTAENEVSGDAKESDDDSLLGEMLGEDLANLNVDENDVWQGREW